MSLKWKLVDPQLSYCMICMRQVLLQSPILQPGDDRHQDQDRLEEGRVSRRRDAGPETVNRIDDRSIRVLSCQRGRYPSEVLELRNKVDVEIREVQIVSPVSERN
jgi:hypothetical protein